MTIKELYDECGWLMFNEYISPDAGIWVENPDDFNNPRKAADARLVGEKLYIYQEDTTE